jgi:hypothetical protein
MTKGKGDQLYVSKFIDESEILSMNYGKSDGERFNFFLVTGAQAILGPVGIPLQLYNITKQSGGIRGLADTASLARFGMRPYITSSNFVVAENAGATLTTNNIVRDMWKRAHLLENGQVTLRGSKWHIPVGTNIVFNERGTIAHVEAVSHSYHVAAGGHKTLRTTITFVRYQSLGGNSVSVRESNDAMRGDWDRGAGSSRIP